MVTKRLYMRCRTLCSAPPVYIGTGSHFFVMAGSHGRLSFLSSRRTSGSALENADSGSEAGMTVFTDGYRKKYHELSRNVSETSVSRLASPWHLGHVV